MGRSRMLQPAPSQFPPSTSTEIKPARMPATRKAWASAFLFFDSSYYVELSLLQSGQCGTIRCLFLPGKTPTSSAAANSHSYSLRPSTTACKQCSPDRRKLSYMPGLASFPENSRRCLEITNDEGLCASPRREPHRQTTSTRTMIKALGNVISLLKKSAGRSFPRHVAQKW
jgi:hypothetical protein